VTRLAGFLGKGQSRFVRPAWLDFPIIHVLAYPADEASLEMM